MIDDITTTYNLSLFSLLMILMNSTASARDYKKVLTPNVFYVRAYTFIKLHWFGQILR